MVQEVRTASDLYDLLQELFGLGDWDPDGDVPWWKARQHEATKIKRSLSARHIDLADVVLAARYAKAHGKRIGAVTWLYKLIPEAIRWDNARRRDLLVASFDEQIAAAMEVEQDPTWVSRLARARGAARQEVLAQWTLHRSSVSSHSTSQENGHGHRTA